MGGLRRPALVDGHIDDDRTVGHAADVVAGDELGCLVAGDEDGADDQVGPFDGLVQGVAVGVHRLHRAAEEVVQVAQAVQIDVQEGHVRPQAAGHLGRLGAHRPAADDAHPPGHGAGHAPQEHAATAVHHLQTPGPGLDGQAPGHFAHGDEQGQAALGVGDRLVGDGDAAALDEPAGEFGESGQVQVGEQHLPLPQEGDLGGLGLLHLHHHGALVDRLGAVHETRSGPLVGAVQMADAGPRAALHPHLVPPFHEGVDARGGEADAKLLFLDFLGDTDAHERPSS